MSEAINPELIEKAARAAYCEDIAPEYREHMWSTADTETIEAYYREARAALEAVADELRATVYAVAHDDGDDMCGGFNLHGIYTSKEAAQARLNEIEGWFLGAAVYPIPLNTPGWLGYRMDGFESSDANKERAGDE